MLSRSAQGTRSELVSTQWHSGPSARWHGAAGADLGCCVSGELLFCQGTVGGLRHGCSIGQKGWEVADGSVCEVQVSLSRLGCRESSVAELCRTCCRALLQ